MEDRLGFRMSLGETMSFVIMSLKELPPVFRPVGRRLVNKGTIVTNVYISSKAHKKFYALGMRLNLYSKSDLVMALLNYYLFILEKSKWKPSLKLRLNPLQSDLTFM